MRIPDTKHYHLMVELVWRWGICRLHCKLSVFAELRRRKEINGPDVSPVRGQASGFFKEHSCKTRQREHIWACGQVAELCSTLVPSVAQRIKHVLWFSVPPPPGSPSSITSPHLPPTGQLSASQVVFFCSHCERTTDTNAWIIGFISGGFSRWWDCFGFVSCIIRLPLEWFIETRREKSEPFFFAGAFLSGLVPWAGK